MDREPLGGTDCFLAKYSLEKDTFGDLLDAIQFGSTGGVGDEVAFGVCLDDDRNVYVTGRTNGNFAKPAKKSRYVSHQFRFQRQRAVEETIDSDIPGLGAEDTNDVGFGVAADGGGMELFM